MGGQGSKTPIHDLAHPILKDKPNCSFINTNRLIDGLTDGLMDGRTGRLMDGPMGGLMDGPTGGLDRPVLKKLIVRN